MQSVIGALRVNLGLDAAQFMRGLNDAKSRLRQTGQELTQIGTRMSAAVSAPIAAFGALTIKTAGDFEASMNQVAAVSGATGEELIALRDTAQELGATTQFSASQAADAMKFLSMAGFDANQTIAALPGTLQLAASAAIDLGDAADIVSNVLSGYGLQIAELGRVNDVLVQTFTSSNTNLTQLGEAMAYVGPVAASAGVQFEETAAALGLLGNAGIQGSMAGTSLRGALTKILSPSKEAADTMERLGIQLTDTQGRIRPLAEVLDELAPHADDAGLFMELFGQRAGPGMAALVSQGSDSLRDLTAELEASGGTAQRIAEAQMQGFNGSMKELASAFEALQLAIADSGLLEIITGMVEKLTEIVQAISEADPRLVRFGATFAALAAAIGPVTVAVGLMVAALGTISAPALAVAAAIAGITAAAIAFSPELAGAKAAVVDFANAVRNSIVGLSNIIAEAFEGLPEQMVQIGRDIIDGLLRGLQERFDAVNNVMIGIGDGLRQSIKQRLGIQSPSKVFHEIGVNIMEGLGNGLSDTGAQVEGVMEGVTDNLTTSIKGMFKAVLFEGKSFKDALASLLGSVGGRMLDMGLSALIPGFASGTNFAPGGLALVGERGPELVNLPRGSQVVPNHNLAQGGGSKSISIKVNVTGARGNREISEMVRQGVSAGLSEYDRSLPDRVAGINDDPSYRPG